MRSVLNLIFAPKCLFCDELCDYQQVCDNCDMLFQRLDGDFSGPHLKRIWFRRAVSLFSYEGKIKKALCDYKYLRRLEFASFFSDLIVNRISLMGNYDCVIPVPLHRFRLFKRGFNQSSFMARLISKRLHIPCKYSYLKRCKNIPSQVGLKRDDRLKNARGAFAVVDKKGMLKGLKVLLIDDVITTGSTVNECAKVLVKNGDCGIVDVISIARTL